MDNFGNILGSIVAIFFGLAALILILWMIGQLLDLQKRGRKGPIGAVIALGIAIVGGIVLAYLFENLTFGWGAPKIENDFANNAGKSKTGTIVKNCIDDPLGPNCGGGTYQSITGNTSTITGTTDSTSTTTQPNNSTANLGQTFSGNTAIGPGGVALVEPDPGLYMTDQTIASCVDRITKTKLANKTVVDSTPSMLIAGAPYTLISPNWGGRQKSADNEVWTLVDGTWGFQYQVSGTLARNWGGEASGLNSKQQTSVTGSGAIPQQCWPSTGQAATQSIPQADPNYQAPLPQADPSAQPQQNTTTAACYAVTTPQANARPQPSTNANPAGQLTQGSLVSGTVTTASGEGCLTSGCDWLQITSGLFANNFIHMSILAPASGCQ